VDAATRDDAAVFQFTADRALVATTDFFTPLVDDARTWGAIAAANALSDIYAMGATPLFALNLVGWPREKLPFALLGEVLLGAMEVAKQAHCLVLGGHSIDSVEPHFGMAVIGEDGKANNSTRRAAMGTTPKDEQAARHGDPDDRAQAGADHRGRSRRGDPLDDVPE